MIPKSTVELIRIRKAQESKSKKKKPPQWLYPHSQERQYDRILHNLVRQIKALIKEILMPEIPFMIAEVETKMPSNDRADNYLSLLNGLIISIRGLLQPTIETTIKASMGIGLSIDNFNEKQFQKLNHTVFGMDLFLDEPWLKDQLELFSNQNAQLIRSLPDQELERVSQAVQRNLQEGKSYRELSSEIEKSFGISRRRANLIARDQTAKLNASLTKLRQQEIGVEEYVWQTSGDERVRATHRAHDGKTFRWDSPPKDTGHPGQDVNCRCVAIAVLDGILDI
jgi:SPP1 gp7 family putative phage head morphogenesis protein